MLLLNKGTRVNASSKAGMTLIELLIVITIVLVLAALSVPLLLRNKISANETSAVGSLKAIANASINFNEQREPHRYPNNLAELGSHDPPYIDQGLAGGVKAGYFFQLVAGTTGSTGSNFTWSAEAHPVAYRKTGIRSFHIDSTGMILGDDISGKPGLPTMPPLQ